MKKVGSWWLPDGEEHLVKYIKRDDGYQQAERDHALSYVKRWRSAIDIGAHVGLWARELSTKFEQLYCFEPIEAHRECLMLNLPEGDCITKISSQALGEHTSKIKIEWREDCTGGSYVSDRGNISCDCWRLDMYQYLIPCIDFIKIDCEGYEEPILRGGEGMLLREKPIINIEQKERRKGSLYIGADTKPFGAVEYLKSLGAVELGRFKSEFVFGWE